MTIYDSIDAKWTWDGDYTVGEDGDLGDTSDDVLESIKTEIRTVVKSSLGDWQQYQFLGAGLTDFIGEPNTRETAESIRLRIESSLSNIKIVLLDDLDIRIVPVHRNILLISMALSVTPTIANNYRSDNSVTISLLYDTIEDNIMFLPPNDIEDTTI